MTAPGREKRHFYLRQRLERGLVDGFMVCDRYTTTPRGVTQVCNADLAWVEDFYPDDLIAAWLLGGPEAAWEIIRVEMGWPPVPKFDEA